MLFRDFGVVWKRDKMSGLLRVYKKKRMRKEKKKKEKKSEEKV